MRTALFCDVTQHVVIIHYQDFGTPLKERPIGCPETSVRNYHYTLRESPEERSSRLPPSSEYSTPMMEVASPSKTFSRTI